MGRTPGGPRSRVGLPGRLCLSSAKVYVGVKQEIAEARIPALNAYMKVTVRPGHGVLPGVGVTWVPPLRELRLVLLLRWPAKSISNGMAWGEKEDAFSESRGVYMCVCVGGSG